MIDSWLWGDRYIFSTWIYSGRYVTVLSYTKTFGEVIDAIRESAQERGDADPAPLILISAMNFMDEDVEALRSEEGLVTLILE